MSPSVSQTQNFQVHLICHLDFARVWFQKHHASDLHTKFFFFLRKSTLRNFYTEGNSFK